MTTITLRYDERSSKMRALIADIIENGAVPEYASNKMMTGYDLTLSALNEIENGGGIACESFIEYKKKVQEDE